MDGPATSILCNQMRSKLHGFKRRLSEEVGPGKCILKAFQDQYSNSFKNRVRAFVDGSLASPLPDADHVLQFEGFS